MLDNQSYIVSFLPGSSGRFITSILWRMLTGGPAFTFTDENAAHTLSPWDTTFTTTDGSFDCNSKKIYEIIEFKEGLGLVHTHTYPDFDIVRSSPKLENTKLIIITVSHDDHQEVAHNWVKKNTDLHERWQSRLLKGLNYFKDNYVPAVDPMQMHNFCNSNVPEDLTSRVLSFNYSDIYKEINGSYVALEKLQKFVGKDANESVVENYHEYVNNRNKLWNK
jgi:hypothetical protein